MITDQYEVPTFGAKIVRRQGSSQVTEVILTEPIEGASAEVVEPEQLGARVTFRRRSWCATSTTRWR